MIIKFLFAIFILICLQGFAWSQPAFVNAQVDFVDPSPIATHLLNQSKDLSFERSLVHSHQVKVSLHKQNYKNLIVLKQPVNKGEQCRISSEVFNNRTNLDDGSIVLWEGACFNGMANGFGRLYLFRSNKQVYELLARLDAKDPTKNIIYYVKDTSATSQTLFFYGKSNMFRTSGIIITQRNIDDEFIVSMFTRDKDNIITYEKSAFLKSKQIHYNMGFTNFNHEIYDLRNSTIYPSLDLTYNMTDQYNRNIGYSIILSNNGRITGELLPSHNQRARTIEPSTDMVLRVIELITSINTHVDDSLKNLLEATLVLDTYKNVVCSPNYNNALCSKINCQRICSKDDSILPDDPRVKKLILQLVHQNKSRELSSYLRKALAARQEGSLNGSKMSQQPKQRSNFYRDPEDQLPVFEARPPLPPPTPITINPDGIVLPDPMHEINVQAYPKGYRTDE